MTKKYWDSDIYSYSADVYFDKMLLTDNDGEKYFIERTKKKRVYIHLRHDTMFGNWVKKGKSMQGVKFVIREKKFSENTGSEWKTIRSVFCEEQ